MVYTTVHDWIVPVYSSGKLCTLRCNYGVYYFSGLKIVDGVQYCLLLEEYLRYVYMYIFQRWYVRCISYCHKLYKVYTVQLKKKLCSSSIFT